MSRRKGNEPAGDMSDPQGMAVMLEAFLESMRVKNFSDQTVAHRKFYGNYFVRWAEERGITRPNEVTKPVLERYQRWLYHYRKSNGDPLSFRTQQHHLVALRMWFRFLARNNHILYNPASELELPKLEYRLPKFILTANEADQIINVADVNTNLGLRDRAILETLYSTGMRRRELMNLKMYDLDNERGTVMIRQGKGKKDRMIPIGERALAWIEKYVVQARPSLLVGDAGGDVLFLTEFGQPFDANRLTTLVANYISAADIGKKGSCHLFRHTMATLMLEGGADIRFIQAMLGHARLETTLIYTKVSVKKLKEIHSVTHPSARLKRPLKDGGQAKPASARDDDVDE
jgi:integrase/recombinase XerD